MKRGLVSAAFAVVVAAAMVLGFSSPAEAGTRSLHAVVQSR
jgi:hypothetical protein